MLGWWAGGEGIAYHSSSYRNGKLAVSSACSGLLLLKLESWGRVSRCLVEAMVSEEHSLEGLQSQQRTMLRGLLSHHHTGLRSIYSPSLAVCRSFRPGGLIK